MTELRRYRNLVWDSARWSRFPFRDDDIVISAPPKSGTTWMQTLCLMLVLDTTEFDRPLAEVSPWLDMQTAKLESVIASLEAQPHRRVIKTHTPLDGLPPRPGVTICVTRDPRDVFLSWQHHAANMDREAVLAARAAAVGLDDLPEFGPPPGPSHPDPAERFRRWVEGEPGAIGVTLPSVLHHLQTFWECRDTPGIALFHYDDLLADLSGELRRLADELSIDLPTERISALAAAGRLDQMRERADTLIPAAGIFRNNREFFRVGSSQQWRRLLDDAALCHYQTRVAALIPPDLAAWAHSDTHTALET